MSGYSREELEAVRRAVSKALEERGIRAEGIEVMESRKFNLRVEIYLKNPCRLSMDDLSHVARRVGETALGGDNPRRWRRIPTRLRGRYGRGRAEAHNMVLSERG